MLTTEYEFLVEVYEADKLLEYIHDFIHAYQETGASIYAWMVYQSANKLWRHPDYEGSDEDRCAFRKLSNQWKMLALSPQDEVGHAA